MNPAALEAMLARGQDNALLRFTLGQLYLQAGEAARAIEHLQRAVEQDAQYSAAWKLLGRACHAAGDAAAAVSAFEHGIAIARDKGDLQAMKEMQVFCKRARRDADAAPGH